MTSILFTIALFLLILAFCSWSRRCDQRERERHAYLDAQHLSGVDQQ